MTRLSQIYRNIVDDPDNAWAAQAGYLPLYQVAPGARIVIVSQAPGRRAQQSGIPWHDPSGVKLRSWLGVTDAQFYDPSLFAILPMDFYFPGKAAHGDLPPRRGFAAKWHPALLAELHSVRLTILIGRYAQQHYLGGRAQQSLTEIVRAYRDYLPSVIPLVHPSPLTIGWQRRNPWFADELLPALKAQVSAALTDLPRSTPVDDSEPSRSISRRVSAR